VDGTSVQYLLVVQYTSHKIKALCMQHSTHGKAHNSMHTT